MDNLVLVMKDLTVEKNFGTETPGVIHIKGYANRYLDNNGNLVVDRSGDSVLPSGYELTNFMKNPILLSYHDRYEPVGKIVDLSVGINGLEITAEVHEVLNSKVFYAVQQGILKTFSIGFKALDSHYDPESDIYYYKKVELLEVSIVAVPDNQESIFTVLTQSPCATGTCLLANKATNEHTYKCASTIKNKEVSDMKWVDVDKDTLQKDLSENFKDIPEAISEAYLIIGDMENKSTWKFPHHELKEGKLVVSKEGVISALSALKSIQGYEKYSKEEQLDAAEHLLKHCEEIVELGMMDETPEWLFSFIDILKEEESAVAPENNDNSANSSTDDNNSDNSDNARENGEESGNQNAEEAEGKEVVPATVTFEDITAFIESLEGTDEDVTSLLRLHSVIENRANTLIKI